MCTIAIASLKLRLEHLGVESLWPRASRNATMTQLFSLGEHFHSLHTRHWHLHLPIHGIQYVTRNVTTYDIACQ